MQRYNAWYDPRLGATASVVSCRGNKQTSTSVWRTKGWVEDSGFVHLHGSYSVPPPAQPFVVVLREALVHVLVFANSNATNLLQIVTIDITAT